jgi:hypothetical protein
MRGCRHRVAGRVSMDQFVIDVGNSRAEMGDEVVLFGPGDRGEPTAAEWAQWADTNPHEILTRVGPRVARRYVNGRDTVAPDEHRTGSSPAQRPPDSQLPTDFQRPASDEESTHG